MKLAKITAVATALAVACTFGVASSASAQEISPKHDVSMISSPVTAAATISYGKVTVKAGAPYTDSHLITNVRYINLTGVEQWADSGDDSDMTVNYVLYECNSSGTLLQKAKGTDTPVTGQWYWQSTQVSFTGLDATKYYKLVIANNSKSANSVIVKGTISY